MAIVAFRFDESPPSGDELDRRLLAVLGRGLFRAIDAVEHRASPTADDDRVVTVCSQDLIALTYARKVCAELGGTRVDLVTKEPRDPAVPAWADTPWTKHPWLARLKIRFGPLGL